MEVAERIGAAAFSFNLLFSIIITVIGAAMIAVGVDPGQTLHPLFLPISWLYSKTLEVQQTLPSDYSPLDLLFSLSLATIFAVAAEFIILLLTGFLYLVYAIATLLPEQLRFLVVPLYVLGIFLQLMSWIYFVNLIFQKLASFIPFFRR